MALLPVVEELLAVVGGDHERGVVPQAALAQQREDAADRLVGRADLAVVLRHDVVELRPAAWSALTCRVLLVVGDVDLSAPVGTNIVS